MIEELIAFMAGAVTLGHVVAGAWFLKSWKKTGDRLFVSFAAAFWLFALNQFLSLILGPGEREIRFEYILRVLGFVLILLAIARKNAGSFRGGK
jgi:hypothetical protein